MKQHKRLQAIGEMAVFLFMIVFPVFVWTDYSDITAMKLRDLLTQGQADAAQGLEGISARSVFVHLFV